MAQPDTSEVSPQKQRRPLQAAIRWLSEPAASLRESARRRSRILAWLLLSLILVGLLALIDVLIAGPSFAARRGLYLLLTGGISLLLIAAYGLNHVGRYIEAAWLTIACTVIGPWISMLMDPGVLVGDFVPLIYTILSVLLCGLLLSVSATVIIAVFQFAALLALSLSDRSLASLDWPGVLALVFFFSVLSIVSNLLSRKDMEQIDRQKRQLADREAELRDQNVRDPLTGLFNRRYLEETLERELRRAERERRPLGVIMLDIDHFKQFNDTFGSAAGDAMLRQVGILLRAHIRASDFACRIGEDEFVLVLPEAPRQVTRERASLLMENARRIRAQHEGRNLGSISISLGVAFYPDHGSTRVTILRIVADALYRAKGEGRDRVVVAD